MSRLTDDQIFDAMLSMNTQQTQQNSRLDEVAQMVAQMEKNLSDRIEQANKKLVDQMQTQINASTQMQETEPKENKENGGISDEDNSGSDLQGAE